MSDNPSAAPLVTAVSSMLQVQSHRGPDGRGLHCEAHAVLGHCRLAIIDLSDAGRQPMCDRLGRYWITFNGEIYNHVELRRKLRQTGHDFEGECVPLACAAPVLSVLLKRICSILVLPPRSMSCVRWLGSMEMNALPHASPLSSGCTMQLKKVSQQ